MRERIREITLSVCLAIAIVLVSTALVAILLRALTLMGALHQSVFGLDGVGNGLAFLVAGLAVLSAIVVVTLVVDAHVRGRWEALRVSNPFFRRRRRRDV